MERAFYAKLELGQHSVLLDRVWDLAGALGTTPSALFDAAHATEPSDT
jgi:transcriptional regulator with XRE-family HTH domain